MLCNLALLAANLRGGGPARGPRGYNRVFLIIAVAALVLLGAALYVPPLADLFQVSAPGGGALLGALFVAFFLGWTVTLLQRWRWRGRRARRRGR